MTSLYLIAHKVRGEPAFDIAERMECPICGNPSEPPNADWEHQNDCAECDGLGYWWIIPTSGHRAHPYWDEALDRVISDANLNCPIACPDPWPDHYPLKLDRSPAPASDILSILGLDKPKGPPLRRL